MKTQSIISQEYNFHNLHIQDGLKSVSRVEGEHAVLLGNYRAWIAN